VPPRGLGPIVFTTKKKLSFAKAIVEKLKEFSAHDFAELSLRDQKDTEKLVIALRKLIVDKDMDLKLTSPEEFNSLFETLCSLVSLAQVDPNAMIELDPDEIKRSKER